MSNDVSRIAVLAVVLVATFCGGWKGLAGEYSPEELNAELQTIARYSEFNQFASEQLLKLPPGAVSATAEMLARETDQSRKQQLTYMLANALGRMHVSEETRMAATIVLHDQLKSRDEGVRRSVISVLPGLEGANAIDLILPLLDDPVESIRCVAAKQLSEIGTARTASAIEEVMTRRRSGLTEQQVRNDHSFQFGYRAIENLRKVQPSKSESSRAKSTSEGSLPLTPPSTITFPQPDVLPFPAPIDPDALLLPKEDSGASNTALYVSAGISLVLALCGIGYIIRSRYHGSEG